MCLWAKTWKLLCLSSSSITRRKKPSVQWRGASEDQLHPVRPRSRNRAFREHDSGRVDSATETIGDFAVRSQNSGGAELCAGGSSEIPGFAESFDLLPLSYRSLTVASALLKVAYTISSAESYDAQEGEYKFIESFHETDDDLRKPRGPDNKKEPLFYSYMLPGTCHVITGRQGHLDDNLKARRTPACGYQDLNGAGPLTCETELAERGQYRRLVGKGDIPSLQKWVDDWAQGKLTGRKRSAVFSNRNRAWNAVPANGRSSIPNSRTNFSVAQQEPSKYYFPNKSWFSHLFRNGKYGSFP